MYLYMVALHRHRAAHAAPPPARPSLEIEPAPEHMLKLPEHLHRVEARMCPWVRHGHSVSSLLNNNDITILLYAINRAAACLGAWALIATWLDRGYYR
jgi:hypothetical protein